jgi:hypothetical protein
LRYVTNDAWEIIRCVESARELRVPLVSGGLLDQPHWFTVAYELIGNDRRGYLMKHGGGQAAALVMMGMM